MRPGTKIRLISLLSLPALGAAGAFVSFYPLPSAAEPATANQAEMNDREVDEAALSSHRAAMARLAQLAKNKKGTPQEPVFLLRLAEITHQAASIEFRIAHGKARLNPKLPVKLENYQKLLAQSIDPLSQIINNYPKDNGVGRAYFLRAKALAETGKKDEAVKDFKILVNQYGTSRDLVSASFYLYDLLIEYKEYQAAILYMKRLKLASDDPNFTLAMDHLAWAHYYINDLDQALKYLEYQVGFYHRRKNATTGMQAEWEKAMMNAALFYSTGVTTKVSPNYTVKNGLNLMLRLRPPRTILSKSLVHFTYLLRAKGMDNELEELKEAAFNSPVKNAEAVDLALVVYENELNRFDLPKLRQTSQILTNWLESNRKVNGQQQRWNNTQKAVIDTAAALQEQFIRKKGTDEVAPLVPVLVSLYNQLLRVSEGSSDRVRLVRIHFNLAEILFDTKDFEGATGHYRWIVDHGVASRSATVDKKHSVNDRTEAALVEEARLKAVASRYESLTQKGFFPKDLTARSMDTTKPTELPPEATTWISWVRDLFQWTKDPVSAEVFFFEANRMLYAQGHIEESLKGMAKFFRSNPKSRYAIPSAALILDTYVASEKWEWAYELCEEYLKVDVWQKTEFREKVLTAAGDTSIKIIELYYKKGAYRDALARAQKFLQQYPKNSHRDDALLLAANCCLAMKDKKMALSYFEPLLKSGNAKPETLALAYLTSTAVAEERYDFKTAAAEMRKYMGVSGPPNNLVKPDELKRMRNKTLMLSVLSGDHKDIAVSLNSKAVCQKPTEVECERYRAVSTLIDLHKRSRRPSADSAMAEISKADPSNRVYYATVALEDRKNLSFEEYLRLFQLVPVDFSQLDWVLRYTVLTPLSNSVPEAVRAARREIRKMAKLKIQKSAIDKRVKLMGELEANANKLLNLPSILIRVSVLNELATMYDDFSSDLKAQAIPEGLGQIEREAYLKSISGITQPFETKRSELRKKAFDLASENAVGDEVFELVSNAYFTENPDVAKDLRPSWLPPKMKPIDVSILEKVDPSGEWTKGGTYKSYVFSAIKEKDWPRAAFFMQEIQDHKEVSEDVFLVIKAVALAGAGAQAEALVKLLEASEKMTTVPRIALMLEAIPRFYRSYSKLKTKLLVEKLAELKRPNDLGVDAVTIAHAARWSGADLPGGYKNDLFALLPQERMPAGAPGKTEEKK